MNHPLHAAQQSASISLRSVSTTELENIVPALAELLRDTVNSGAASLGFWRPLAHDQARDYWLSLRPELHDGSRLLFAAYAEGRLVGSGQLVFPPWPNARHRAELQKLLVAPALRGRGFGRSLLSALHEAAQQRGRSLLMLNTRRGERAENFYKRLGYREVGVIPGYSRGSAGERYDTVALYQELSK